MPFSVKISLFEINNQLVCQKILIKYIICRIVVIVKLYFVILFTKMGSFTADFTDIADFFTTKDTNTVIPVETGIHFVYAARIIHNATEPRQ